MTVYSDILRTVLAEDHMDCLFNVIWTGPSQDFVEEYLKFYKALQGRCQKSIATWIYGPSLPLIHEMSGRMEDLGFPVFSDLETAIKALGIAYHYSNRKKGGE
jgi:hypothetical protein